MENTFFNKEQHSASCAGKGIHLVIAGPGTGKTRTLIERIINTASEFQVPVSSLLVLTFSRKAGDEIRERLNTSGIDITGVFSGTFHSFCLHLLKENSSLYLEHSGMKEFPIIIDSEQEDSILRCLFMERAELFMGLPYDAALEIIKRPEHFSAKKYKRIRNCGLCGELEKLKKSYIQHKMENSLIDYSDMVDHAINLLESYEDLKENVRSKYTFIFVDEFQDTSDSDFRLLLLISGKQNIFMVGDDCQSIYRFRGSRVEYIINPGKFFHDAMVYRLTANYRSHSEIVLLSNMFISHNRFRTKKRITSIKGKGGKVKFLNSHSSSDELNLIRGIIDKKSPLDTCAVLYRNNYQGHRIRSQLKTDDSNLFFLTMHSSKGLEFDMVIITGVCDGIIPDRDSDIEDERRLFYVALTRAKKMLYIIYEKNRNHKLPRFIAECGLKS